MNARLTLFSCRFFFPSKSSFGRQRVWGTVFVCGDDRVALWSEKERTGVGVRGVMGETVAGKGWVRGVMGETVAGKG
jgi:hypothetical protein